jgi:hypothetical protein
MKTLLLIITCVGVATSVAQTGGADPANPIPQTPNSSTPRVISPDEQAEMAAKERILMRMRISEIEERDRAGALRPPRRGLEIAEQESNALRAKMIVLERTDVERSGGPLIPPAPTTSSPALV